MSRGLITLTTDFGLKDSYVGEMKAAILGINPDCTIVDITHQVEKFNIRMGAYVLASSVPCFPKGTIHVAVVDPGVGGKRQPILIETETSFLIGPDNGVLALAARKAGNLKQMRRITNRKMMLSTISNTFHGRDIFAPVAAHLTIGAECGSVGPRIFRIATPAFARVQRRKNMVVGEVLHVDDFGNVITNLGQRELESAKVKGAVDLKIGRRTLSLRLCRTYADVEEKKPLVLFGSHNFLELSVNQGDAAKIFDVKIGDRITVCSNRS